jgi:hypothetical protein
MTASAAYDIHASRGLSFEQKSWLRFESESREQQWDTAGKMALKSQ